MVAKGYQEEFAARIFKQLEGFGSYGFPESHAASFALLVYISSWLKWYYPDVFCTALLNSQPMGFYQPAQIVIDARNHDVKVLAVDVNHSYWDNTIEAPGVVRLGFRQVKGLNEQDMITLIGARLAQYTRVDEIPVQLAALEKLADADAFRSMGLDRRHALWQVSALADKPVALFEGKPEPETQVTLPLMKLSEHVVQDYATTGLSLKKHPVALVREKLNLFNAVPMSRLKELKDGDSVKVAGLITVRQRPGTAKGILFITLEDESGNANLVVWQKLFDTYRKEIIQSRLLMVEGKVQIEGEVIHVVVRRCFNLSGLLRGLTAMDSEDLPVLSLARADETTAPPPDPRQVKVSMPLKAFHKGRNFR
jgi:error-prone DNA polymerase